MHKRAEINLPVMVLSVFGILVFGLGLSFIYFSLNGKDYTETYDQRFLSGEIENPIQKFNLNGVEINFDESTNVSEFEKESVGYALTKLKIYNLHNTPFILQTPKIEVSIDNTQYSVEVLDGEISVEAGTVSKEDILIKTTKEEVLKMAQDESYVSESFGSGSSEVELVANKFI